MTLDQFIKFTMLEYGDSITVYDYLKEDKWGGCLEYGEITKIKGIPASLNDHLNRNVHFQSMRKSPCGNDLCVFID